MRRSTFLFQITVALVALCASIDATAQQRYLYGVDCNTGPCLIYRIGFDGSVVNLGQLFAPGGVCDNASGGTSSVLPIELQGMAFDSQGRLWATGDNGAGGGSEWLFEINPVIDHADFIILQVIA